MRFLRRSLVGLFLVALTVGLLSYAGGIFWGALETRWAEETRSRPARERVFSVNVISVEPQDIEPVLSSFGQIRAIRSLDLRAPIGGTLVELSPEFREGGTIRQGDLLVKIDPSDAQTALDVAKTDLVEAQADFSEAQAGAALAQDELSAAQEQLALQSRALQRQRDLKDRGVGTEASVESAELSEASSKQAVLARRQALQQAKARVTQTATLIERSKISLREAERLLADTNVYAEFDGILSDVTATKGVLVANNERLAQLIDPKALEVSFRISTAQYAQLLDDAGDLILSPVEVTLEVLGTDLSYTGRLSRESAAVAEGTTGRVLFAELDDTRGLRPGDFVAVKVRQPELRRVALLPSTAVSANGTVLVLEDGDRLAEAEIRVLRRQTDDVIARVGAIAGREIVAERSPLLGLGVKVNPIRQGAAPAEPELVELDQDRRARLIAFVEANKRMPDDVKERLLSRLNEAKVPAEMITRLESRMGS